MMIIVTYFIVCVSADFFAIQDGQAVSEVWRTSAARATHHALLFAHRANTCPHLKNSYDLEKTHANGRRVDCALGALGSRAFRLLETAIETPRIRENGGFEFKNKKPVGCFVGVSHHVL